MTNEENASPLEDNLPMVNYIMLHRIYDMLTLIADSIADKEKVKNMIDYHDSGFLLGPAPSYSPQEEESP